MSRRPSSDNPDDIILVSFNYDDLRNVFVGVKLLIDEDATYEYPRTEELTRLRNRLGDRLDEFE